jgi:twitching motility protein PilT
MARIDQLIEIISKANATDLHMVAGSVPVIRVEGRLEKTRHRRLTDDDIKELIYEILSDRQIRILEKTGRLDFAYGVGDIARVRLNVYQTHTGMAAAIRLIPSHPPDLDSLGFSDAVRRLAESKSGLVLVTGPINSGKTTTLAAMIDYINSNFSRHIITLEDPIEYIHESANSLVSQRQVGLHVESFASALRAALREDPDVIMVGEMRDTETISLAVTAAEAGLLVLGTLHTATTAATVDRIIDVFPTDQQQQIRIMLADSLTGIISQHLVKRCDGHGRILAYELLLQTASLPGLIRESKTNQIPDAIRTGGDMGMQFLDDHLEEMVESGLIAATDAAKAAVKPSRFHDLKPSTIQIGV